MVHITHHVDQCVNLFLSVCLCLSLSLPLLLLTCDEVQRDGAAVSH